MPTTTPLMGLSKPTGGPSGDTDVWGTVYLNGDLDLLDAHDHVPGKGAPVKSAGLRIDGDVQWNYNGSYWALLNARALGLKPQPASSVVGDLNVFYVDSATNNLFFRNNAGNSVRLINGNLIDMTLLGGIVGDYAAVGAEVAFEDANDTYTFKQQGSPRPWARMRCGDVDLYEAAASITNRVRLRSPAALAASYQVTWPAAVPAGQRLLQTSSTGVLTFDNTGVEAVTMATNASVTVSGASGDFKHGDRTIHLSGASTVVTGTSYTPSVTSDVVSWLLGATGIVHIELRGLRAGDRLKSVRIRATSTSEPTIVVVEQVDNAASTLATTTSGGPITAVGSITHTLNTPVTPNSPGDLLWLKISAGANPVTVYTIDAVVDRP